VRGVRLQLPPATTRHVYLTHAQVRALAQAATPRTLEVYVLAYCGLRWSELAGLRVGDVDVLHRRFTVAHAVTVVAGRQHFGEPKGRKTRTVPYPAFLAGQIADRVKGRLPSAPLFPARGGGWMRPPMLQGPLTAACRAVGLGRLTPHHLRHTCASLAVSSGANVKGVQQLLGHKSAVITLDTYTDLFPDDLSAVMGRLDVEARKVRGRDPDGIRPALGSV
jgi:integrase